MAKDLSELVRSADWKLEKHVPAITAPAEAKAGEWIDVDVSVGQEIPHPLRDAMAYSLLSGGKVAGCAAFNPLGGILLVAKTHCLNSTCHITFSTGLAARSVGAKQASRRFFVDMKIFIHVSCCNI